MPDKEFKPAWWLPGSHLQTLWPAVCRRDVKLALERERIELPDGDFIDLDWVNKNKTGPIVMILHGLEGSIKSHYAKSLMQRIAENNWRGVFMHFRGCSGEPNRLPRGYHSGETNDVKNVVGYILDREKDGKLAVIGISLGGNVLLKWLGETGDNNPLSAAIAVSAPFELHKAANRIQRGFSKFYQWYFIRCLRNRLSEKFGSEPTSLDLSILEKVNTMYEFDEKITAPLHGFASADEYYSTASSRQYLRSIQVPTLILHAEDDPFMSSDVIPEEDELSSRVTLEVTKNGGHVGFVSGKYPWKPEYWLDLRIPEFLKEHLKIKND